MTKKKHRIKRKKKDKTMYYIGVAIAALLILSVGTLTMLLMPEEEEKPRELPPAPPRPKDPHLNIENVFFQKAGEATRQTGSEVEDMVIVRVYSYITNDGTGDAKTVKITALPLDDAMNMASDKVDKTVGDIRVNKTSESEFLVEVPKGIRHEVFLMIWEDGRIILKGTGSFMVETNVGTSQDFQTTEIIGSRNDSDYDGMSDAWETYYGLDPSDPTDADEDKDGDGISNRGEYLGGSEPADPNKKSSKSDADDESSNFAITFIGIVLVVIIAIIIIIIAAVKGSTKQTQNIEHRTYNTAPIKPEPQKSAVQKPPTGPVTCLRCGGMIQNLRCQHCGMDYNQNGTNNGNNY